MAEDYLEVLRRRNLLTWAWAFLAAIFINVGLFIIMPMLQNHECAELSSVERVPNVELVRIQPQERIRPEPEPAKEEPERIPEAIRPPAQQVIPITPKPLELPFQIDPGFQPATKALGDLPMDFTFRTDLQPEGIFSADKLDTHVGVQIRVPPVYPIRARERRIEGWVKVKLLVDESGRVANAEVVEAHPPGYFEKSVLSCVKKWKLTSPTVAGNPVKTWMSTTIRFRLEK
jgi:protein TonB